MNNKKDLVVLVSDKPVIHYSPKNEDIVSELLEDDEEYNDWIEQQLEREREDRSLYSYIRNLT